MTQNGEDASPEGTLPSLPTGARCYFGSGVTNSTIESCTQPLPSFLYQRMTMPVLRNSGDN